MRIPNRAMAPVAAAFEWDRLLAAYDAIMHRAAWDDSHGPTAAESLSMQEARRVVEIARARAYDRALDALLGAQAESQRERVEGLVRLLGGDAADVVDELTGGGGR